jgi:hypothetical protein
MLQVAAFQRFECLTQRPLIDKYYPLPGVPWIKNYPLRSTEDRSEGWLGNDQTMTEMLLSSIMKERKRALLILADAEDSRT